MAEAILNKKGFPSFTAFSAGSHPSGQVHSEARRQIESTGMPTENLRSKSWHESEQPESPKMHFVFTTCDRAAAEVCPVWSGHPLTAQWSVPDPATVQGTPDSVRRAFLEAFTVLDRRITLFLCQPLETLGREVVQREIDQIGRS